MAQLGSLKPLLAAVNALQIVERQYGCDGMAVDINLNLDMHHSTRTLWSPTLEHDPTGLALLRCAYALAPVTLPSSEGRQRLEEVRNSLGF